METTAVMNGKAESINQMPESPVLIEKTIQLRNVIPVVKLDNKRYVERDLWLQHLANKLNEIQIHPSSGEREMTEPTVVESSKDRSDQTESGLSSASSQMPGKPLSDEITDDDEIAGPFLEDMMQAQWQRHLSTIEEEKTGDIPSTCSYYDTTTITEQSTEIGPVTNCPLLSSLPTVLSPAAGSVDESDPSLQCTWLPTSRVDIHTFIREMMHSSSPKSIKAIDGEKSAASVAFVYVNRYGLIKHVCSLSSKTVNAEDVD